MMADYKASGDGRAKRRWQSAAGLLAATALVSPAQAALAQSAPAATSEAPAQPAASSNDTSGDIVVTAQRREESINRVPISVATYSRELMDREGIRRIDDIARLTPALRFTQTSGVTGNNGSNIVLRGVASDVGSSTTAIYIDDTPIQIRNVGYFGGNPYPRVFDLERVEVLRGPQGTLFGAGAEGGAVRFITPQPDADAMHLYSRAEVSTTKNGAISSEAGLAVGGPVTPTLSIRASGWFRRDGGYIDQVTPQTNTVIAKDINSERTYATKVALTWKPIDGLSLTPGIYYQKIESNARSNYWEDYGNASDSDYKTGVYRPEPTSDGFTLSSLKAQYDFGHISFISNTSYFDRRQRQTLNYLNYFSFLRSGSPFGTYANKQAGNADDFLTMRQRNFVQEARLQSYDNRLIDWTAGVYYARTIQYFTNYTSSGRIPGVLVNGFKQYDGRYSFVELLSARDRQIAGYASVDIKPVAKLKITLAARYTHNDFTFVDTKDGPTNSGVRSTLTQSQSEGAWTPRFNLSYQLDANNLLYATASKGFRPGGAQPQVNPEFCAKDLKTLGLTTSPTGYKSDSLWSYEAGSKNKLFGGKLNLDLNGYYIKWKNIQQSLRLPTCSFSFISNLGSATGKGAEISVSVQPVPGVTIGGNVGYTRMTYDQNIFGGNGLLLRAKDQRIGGPLWSGHVYGQIDRPIGDNVNGYARADYSFASKGIQSAIPGTFGYDPGLYALNGTNFVSVRLGARMKGLDLSLFVDNVTDSHDVIARNHDGAGSPLYYDQGFRPRTFGLTGQFRY